MRRAMILLLTCLSLLLTGCSEYREVENLAFALILGVDLTEDDQIEISVQVPKIAGKDGASDAGDSGEGAELVYSARAATFAGALESLQWIVPRRLDLSQLKLIVVSEKLARDDRFRKVADAMTDTYRIYSSAHLAVCEGDARSFVEGQSPQIGSRMASELAALFEDSVHNGFSPDARFADYYYGSASIYSDPISMYAAVPAEESSKPASALLTPSHPAATSVRSPQSNRYLGAALFHRGKMIGRLDGEQTLACLLLRGHRQSFLLENGGQSVSLKAVGRPKISIDTRAESPQIDVRLRFRLLSDAPDADLSALEDALSESLLGVVQTCQALGCEPFFFAERAVRTFSTLDHWLEYDWPSRFQSASVQIQTEISREDA